MDIFNFRDQVISNYSSYVKSFIQIRDLRIQDRVEQSLQDGLLWPESLIQLNPAFEPGGWIDDFVKEGLLNVAAANIFRVGKTSLTNGRPLRLHKHQADAIKIAKTKNNYVLTTGTASGKSLSYIIPIVDLVLRSGSGKGIKAIVIYPMNALANSQEGELHKFLNVGYPDSKGPVTFARYTGQENDERRKEIIANPPDILLTNYMMLELIMTRPDEAGLVRAAEGLRYLVLDELHTYRGRQGADVGLLVRRVKNKLNAHDLQFVGTSATIAGKGTFDEKRTEVAQVASQLFGSPVSAENVIGETLRRITPGFDPISNNSTDFVADLRHRISDPNVVPAKDFASFSQDPLSIWLESTFGIETDSEGRLVRARPKQISGNRGAAQSLHELTGVTLNVCESVIRKGLLAGYECETDPTTGLPPFAFRLHQFISRGDTVYSSLETEDTRYITLFGQQFVPGNREKTLLPLVFCRECGQEYYSVNSTIDVQNNSHRQFIPRHPNDFAKSETGTPGYLYINSVNPWSDRESELVTRLPDDWLEEINATLRVRANRRKDVPQLVRVAANGKLADSGLSMYFVTSPFRFCLQCGVSYGSWQKSDFEKLSSLGSEGRSTATTITSLSAIRSLKKETSLGTEARKLLSFTDNRQDASLQAGHFNDFVEIGLLRSALYQAVAKAGEVGLAHGDLAQKVFEALKLDKRFYASNPEVRFQGERDTNSALREVLGYRIYRDLRRGWRITSPNLEQCGLLQIKYPALQELCEAEDMWQEVHPALNISTPEIRAKISAVLLDYMRRELAIKVTYLDPIAQERSRQQSSQHLIAPWAIDENERIEHSSILFPRPKQKFDSGENIHLSARGGFGLYLRRKGTFPELGRKLNLEVTQQVITELLAILNAAGIVEAVWEPKKEEDGEVSGYQLSASAMQWTVGDGVHAFHDPIRRPNEPEKGSRTNKFFVDFYRSGVEDMHGLEAHEHTAQVEYEERQDREEKFRKGELPVLYCSPTMELGVDISQLNVVNMRNIPPTPANYAQRSGRAGRSGQPAFVFSYCSIGSSHDQYFFRRPEGMVSGAVSPPRLDLANEDLIKAHIHSIWLSETGLSLGKSLKDLLDLSSEVPTMELYESVKHNIENDAAKIRAKKRSDNVLSMIGDELSNSEWYTDKWLDEVLNQAPRNFDRAADRWRELYTSALNQAKNQDKVIRDASRSTEDKKQAERLRREAESQLKLLLEVNNLAQSDFYSYRYFASEGFLPGYNFPRLPISAYIPARRTKQRDEFLSRPRFLALTEFGPRSVIYHEGSRYVINRVILPVKDDDEVLTRRAKVCEICGYLHPILDGEGQDLCEKCNAQLSQPLSQMFRLENVSTVRKDKINSDEEERVRQGYEILTGIRFADHGGKPVYRTATITSSGETKLAQLAYGQSASIWRINLGWRRRANQNLHGFVLDTEKGFWSKNVLDVVGDHDDVPTAARTSRVIPFVEDTRNCLLLEPGDALDANVAASLMAAIKRAIQTKFQLEDRELAAELLPDSNKPRQILFYESSEGGAGVLRRLVDDVTALSSVAEYALEICHFDPQTGEDLRRAPGATEDCEAACYDCLMNYYNQRDHLLLDRQLIKEILLDYKERKVESSPVTLPRGEHFQKLCQLSGSTLETKWLQHVEKNELRLPSHAQKLVEACHTRPDFIYEEYQAAIYVDGPYHDFPDRAARDKSLTDNMEDFGYTVIRFHHEDDWTKIFESYPNVFGVKK